MKRLIVCCDGTWNEPDQDAPTNVVKIALAIAEHDSSGVEQRVYYNIGVGTGRGERLRGGAFGFRLSRHVRECYRFLVETYAPGDELYFFGFSRGAFTARSTAGLVRNSGILRHEHASRIDDAYKLYRARDVDSRPRGTTARLFRRSFSYEPPVRFIGVWDTVGALGIPTIGPRWANVLNHRWRFHDTGLSSRIKFAYQALAIDERRGPFEPALWARVPDAPPEQVLEQVWFAGVHSDVGGGYARERPDGTPIEPTNLPDITLLWMADRAAAAGLDFKQGWFGPEAPPNVSPRDARADGRLVEPGADAAVHDSCKGIYRWLKKRDRRPGREEVVVDLGGGKTEWRLADDQSIASTARDRSTGADYPAPADLRGFLGDGGAVTEVRTTPGLPEQ